MSLLKRDMGVSFEQTLPKDALCQVWLKLAHWIFKSHCVFAISSLSPYGERHDNQLPFTQGCTVPSLVETNLKWEMFRDR